LNPCLDRSVTIRARGRCGSVNYREPAGSLSFYWEFGGGVSQILPGERSTAFVGLRPMTPGKVSGPLLVLVDNRTGGMTAISLWQ
jgi:hypothetical protein